ncbi:MAG: type II toxin-antitoxin system HicA family toxin [Flavobacteriales bacterium]|nr:type II toxin-antitoxin system HicA family toxin [Flavobacteriales bacterium]
MAKTPSLTAAELIKLLRLHGFEFVRAKGSHQIFKNRTTGKMTIVPMHKGDLPKGTLLAILGQAGIDKESLV